MPQTYNPFLQNSQDDSPMGQSSRYMKTIEASSMVTRRAQAITELDKRHLQKRLKGVEVYEQRAERRFERIRKHLQERIQIKRAHNLVTQSMSFTIERNYQRALRERHLDQFRARQYDRRLNYVLKRMDPTLKRESEAKILLERARFEVDRDIEHNKDAIFAISGATKPVRYLAVPSRTSTSSVSPVSIPELGSRFKKLGPISSHEEKDENSNDSNEEVSEKKDSVEQPAPAVQVRVAKNRDDTPLPVTVEVSTRKETAAKLGVTTKPYYGRSRSNTQLFNENSNLSNTNTKPVIETHA